MSRWFSLELIWLLTRLLDTNLETRFTISKIMENRWFKKGFKHIKFYIEDDRVCDVEDEKEEEEEDDNDSVSSLSETESESGFEAIRRSRR